MTKTKGQKSEDLSIDDSPEFLSDFTFSVYDENGNVVESKFDQEAHTAMRVVNTVVGLALTYADNLSADEGILVHSMCRHLKDLGDDGMKTVKPRLVELAEEAGGTVKTDLGTVKLTKVSPSVEKVYTDNTVVVLETAGLLPRAVDMVAEMKTGIDVEGIPEEDLMVIKKYFDVEFVPSPDKIAGLIALGEIDASTIEETTEEVVTRKGSDRLTVTPSDDLKSFLSIEEDE